MVIFPKADQRRTVYGYTDDVVCFKRAGSSRGKNQHAVWPVPIQSLCQRIRVRAAIAEHIPVLLSPKAKAHSRNQRTADQTQSKADYSSQHTCAAEDKNNTDESSAERYGCFAYGARA